MAVTKTYYVGIQGSAKRLNALAGLWIDISLNTALNVTETLLDVETSTNNPDKVFVVGGGNGTTNFGIYVSSNAGATWQVPTGTYTLPFGAGSFSWNEVTVVNPSTIFVAGNSGYVAFSTDGGLSFNLCTALPLLINRGGFTPVAQNVLSIHFISPLIGIVGAGEYVLSTIDGGISWNVLNGGVVLTDTGIPSGMISGIHLSATGQTIVVLGDHGIFYSTNSGASFTIVHNYLIREGKHLTWLNDTELWGFGLHSSRLRSVDGGATWSTLSATTPGMPNNFAGHFYSSTKGFYSDVLGFFPKDIIATTNGGISGIISDTASAAVSAIWTHLIYECYRLIDCQNPQNQLTGIITDLSAVVGQIIQITGNPTCWQVSRIDDNCPNQIEIGLFTIYTDCIDCLPKCYILSDCLAVDVDIITDSDLSSYVGQVIQINNCDTCWLVTATSNCTGAISVIVKDSFATCQECGPQPIPIPDIVLKQRSIKPGFNTVACPPEFVESVNCNYAKQVYNVVKALRYGIASCCADELQKWTIEKELLELNALKDPDVCKLFISPCCAPCNVIVTFNVFNPVSCPAPTNASVIFTII